jgi:hypothetical protein
VNLTTAPVHRLIKPMHKTTQGSLIVYVSVRCFIHRFNKPMHRGVNVKFIDAPEIFVVLFIGETPLFNRFNRKKTSVNQL